MGKPQIIVGLIVAGVVILVVIILVAVSLKKLASDESKSSHFMMKFIVLAFTR